MLFVLNMAVILHLLCFSSYCILNRVNRQLYQ